MERMHQRECTRVRQAGFSLIEVALALMVISIGLVSLLGLMPASMDLNRKAINDTQMGLLGENVLNGYRASLLIKGWDKWATIEIPGTAKDIWDQSQNTEVKPGKGTVVYQIISDQVTGPDLTIEDVSARYDFSVADNPVDPGNLLSCRLRLFPGQAGSTNDLTFYTEVYQTDLEWK